MRRRRYGLEIIAVYSTRWVPFPSAILLSIRYAPMSPGSIGSRWCKRVSMTTSWLSNGTLRSCTNTGDLLLWRARRILLWHLSQFVILLTPASAYGENIFFRLKLRPLVSLISRTIISKARLNHEVLNFDILWCPPTCRVVHMIVNERPWVLPHLHRHISPP